MKIPFKIDKFGIIWWGGPEKNHFFFTLLPNYLEKNHRYLGKYYIWHDGPHYSYGFWFFNINWEFPWSSYKEEEMFIKPKYNDWKF